MPFPFPSRQCSLEECLGFKSCSWLVGPACSQAAQLSAADYTKGLECLGCPPSLSQQFCVLQDQSGYLFMPHFPHWDKLPYLKQPCIKIKVAIITHNLFPAAIKGDGCIFSLCYSGFFFPNSENSKPCGSSCALTAYLCSGWNGAKFSKDYTVGARTSHLFQKYLTDLVFPPISPCTGLCFTQITD